MSTTVAMLAVCQALLTTTLSLVVSTSALVGMSLSPDPALATVPLGAQFTVSMLCTLPASFLMRRIGRRAGFLIGVAAGTVGASACAAALAAGSFAGFIAGAALLGVFTAFGTFYRFAAADAAVEAYRSRAISWVMVGGLAAAFVGPNLARWTRDAVPDTPFLGSFAALTGVIALSAVALAFARIPRPTDEERTGARRSIGRLVRQPELPVAMLGALTSYGVMNLLMTTTPLAMHGHDHPFDDTAFVIQWHLVGMFAPSFVTGELIRRFGAIEVMLAAGFVLAGSVAVNLAGTSVPHFWLALLLLGVGWNFLFVGSTTLLTGTYRPAEKAVVQGTNDLLVFATVALTALSSGYLHHRLGWSTLNLAVLPPIALVVAAVWRLRRRGRRLDSPS